MREYTDIQENRALSALLGKSPKCCWQTETIGYYVRLWREYLDGEHVLIQERKAKTYGHAQQIARKMVS